MASTSHERIERLHWELTVQAQMDVTVPMELGGRVAYDLFFPEETLDVILRLEEAHLR